MKKGARATLSVGFLFDDTLDGTDGVAQYVKTLGAWMSSQGHEVSYLVGETKMDEWAGGKIYSLARNQTVVFNGNRLSMPLPANRRNIKKVIAERHFDVLHVQVPYSPFMAKYVINAAEKSTAVIGTFHVYPSAPWVDVGTRLLRLLLGRSLKKFDQIVSVSQPTAGFAKKTFNVQTDVLPNVVDISRFKASETDAVPGKVVFLGRLVERKGCLYLLKAFQMIVKSVPDVRLEIAGDGPQRDSLERFVERHRLSGKVRFLGRIDEKDKPDFLASAAIACFPSLYGESFGIVLIEAMAAGAGVVLGGNNPGYASVLGARKELLIDPRDTAAFAARLQKILNDQALSLELHKWQTAEVKKYDVSTVGPKIIDLYHQAIAKRGKASHN